MLLPMGDITKNEARSYAAERGFEQVAAKKDSMGVCFCPLDYRSFLKREVPETLLSGKGRFVDEKGDFLGWHEGYPFYTVGQRRGLGIHLNKAVFVKETRVESNEVVLAPLSSLYRQEMWLGDWNLVENMMAAKKGLSAQSARNRLAAYDFGGEDVFKPVSVRSGGEQSRLRLCMLMDEKINLLILDEPTNHLDVASREWIEEAVESYEGNLLFVSHARYFINRFATRIWMLENGQIIDFRGTFEEYRAAQERKRLQAAVLVKAEPEKPKKEKPRRPGGTKELEKQVAAAERAVAKAEERQYELTLKAEEVASNYLELQKVYDEQKALEEEIAALYTKWETLAAELEEARG